ncbi:serine/threonine-protein kinase, partial [Salinibacter ruber]|uniref:serine/threonine-protein kinase n=1 Tax=Salinibacter ruber TaxID=146919 RepID=UPI002073FD78
MSYSCSEAEQFQYGLNRFLKEARTLAQFDHANIVGVQDFFEANGTAYLVMDYHKGKPLDVYLDERAEEWMDPEVATEIMLRVLDGLKAVHAEGDLRRDIKPDNVYLTRTGRPILIDFGAARQAMDERSRSLSVVLTEGYAPYEQYREDGDQGPWTDIYG